MSHACRLAWIELKHRAYSLLMTVALAALLGYLFGLGIAAEIAGNEAIRIFNALYAADFLFVAVLPMLGCSLLLTNESLLKRVQFYRMWAIPVRVVAWSRMIHMLVCLVAGLVGFLVPFTAVTWRSFSLWGSAGEYAAFVLALAGFAVALNGINPVLELAASTRNMILGQSAFLLLGVGAVWLTRLALGQPIYAWLLDMVERNAPGTVAAALAMAALGIACCYRALLWRMIRKDFG